MRASVIRRAARRLLNGSTVRLFASEKDNQAVVQELKKLVKDKSVALRRSSGNRHKMA